MKVVDKRSSAHINKPDYRPSINLDEENCDASDLKGKGSDEAEHEIVLSCTKAINNYFSVEANNVGTFRDDVNFVFNDQWTADLRATRSQKKKAVLTFNYLKAHIDSLLGEEIQNDPDIMVSANDANVNQDQIKLANDWLRQVFYENKMSIIKQYCFMYMLSGGFSVIEVGYDYESPKTFNKKITLDWTDDPTMYFFDPQAKKADKSDSTICGKIISLTEDEYKMYYPNAETNDSILIQYESDDYTYKGYEGKRIKIAQVFKKEFYEETIVLLSNGESMTKEEAEELLSEQDSLMRQLKKHEQMGAIVPGQFKQKITIIEERQSVCFRIMHYTINNSEILEYGEWPSKLMPYVFVPCYFVKIDGMARYISYHRYAQDAQRWLNYLASESCDILMTSHHKNWKAPAKCFDGQLLDMALSPQNTSPILLYNETPGGGVPEYVPPPQLSPEFATQFNRTVGDISNILGRFEANRGQQGNEKSGIAIDKRALFGNISSIVPFENLMLAIEQAANICMSLRSAVLDTKRIITVRSKDKKERKVTVNEEYNGEVKNDMSFDGFKVTIEAGVSFAAQKSQSMAQLQSLISSEPAYAQLLGDLMAENMQVNNMPQIVDRIREYMLGVPLPQIIAKETGQKVPPTPPNPMMQMQQQMMQQEMALKQQQMKNETNKIALQAQEQISDAIDSHAKNITDIKKMNMEIVTDSMKSNAEIQKAKLDNHIDLVKHFSGHAHNERMAKMVNRGN